LSFRQTAGRREAGVASEVDSIDEQRPRFRAQYEAARFSSRAGGDAPLRGAGG
jgi:hypothetical protein